MRSFRLHNPECPKCGLQTKIVRTPWNLLKIGIDLLIMLASGSCLLTLDWKCTQCGSTSHQPLD